MCAIPRYSGPCMAAAAHYYTQRPPLIIRTPHPTRIPDAAAPVSAANSKASRCGVGCSRCASKSSTACYACKTGYVLNGAGSCGEWSCWRGGGGAGGTQGACAPFAAMLPHLPPPTPHSALAILTRHTTHYFTLLYFTPRITIPRNKQRSHMCPSPPPPHKSNSQH